MLPRRQGVTLIELLVTMTILVVVLGALMSLYLSCLRSYAVQALGASAQTQARWAVRAATPYLREMRVITHAQSNYLRWHPPKTDQLPPDLGVEGHVLVIYPGTEQGQPDTDAGDHLWLASNQRGGLTPVKLLADDIVPGTGVQFTYLLSDGTEVSPLAGGDKSRLRGVRMAVTTVQYVHGQPRYATQEGTVVLRTFRAEEE